MTDNLRDTENLSYVFIEEADQEEVDSNGFSRTDVCSDARRSVVSSSLP